MPSPEDRNAASQVALAIVQTKPRKGRYAENLADLAQAFEQLAAEPPDLVVLPEAALTGYFLEGAVYDVALTAERFASDLAATWRTACGERPVELIGGFYENDDGTYYNSAVAVRADAGGWRIEHRHRKLFLPTYGVFDEARFVSRGRRLETFAAVCGCSAIAICEDVWHSIVPTIAAVKGARVLFVPSAAPGRGIDGAGELTSVVRWHEVLRSIALEHGMYVVYAGLTGFEGGKGMTGSSCVVDPRGEFRVRAPLTEASIVRAVLDWREVELARAGLPLLGDLADVLPDLLLDDQLPLPRGIGGACTP